MGSIPGSGRFPGGGHGNPLQYSCLENPRDNGAWWAAVYGVTQSRTQLKRLSSSSTQVCFSFYFFWLGCVLLLGFEKQGIWLIIDSIKHLLSLLHSVIFSGPQLHVYGFLAVYPLLSLVSVFHLLHFYVASGLFLKTNLLSHYFSFQLCLFYFLS